MAILKDDKETEVLITRTAGRALAVYELEA
jgi:hypothetical protein